MPKSLKTHSRLPNHRMAAASTLSCGWPVPFVAEFYRARFAFPWRGTSLSFSPWLRRMTAVGHSLRRAMLSMLFFPASSNDVRARFLRRTWRVLRDSESPGKAVEPTQEAFAHEGPRNRGALGGIFFIHSREENRIVDRRTPRETPIDALLLQIRALLSTRTSFFMRR